MPSNRLLKIAKDIVCKDRELFDALMEFEQTKKVRTKVRLNFTIDKNTALRFKRFSRAKGYNMSSKIEHAMLDMINSEQNKK